MEIGGSNWKLLNHYSEKGILLEELFLGPTGSNTKYCPKCQDYHPFYKVKNRNCYECGKCRYQIRPFKGTILEGTKIDLSKWIYAIHRFSTTGDGVKALELARAMDISESAAFYFAHKIRSLMNDGDFEQEGGVFEIDETYVKGRGRQFSTKPKKKTVVAIYKREGGARAYYIPRDLKKNTFEIIKRSIKPGSTIYTDEHSMYSTLEREGYRHDTVCHKKLQYSKGDVTTNHIENFWGRLKPILSSVNMAVSEKYLQSYLNEFCFRHNRRDNQSIIMRDILNKIINSSQIRIFDSQVAHHIS